jgi:hypothetical protein
MVQIDLSENEKQSLLSIAKKLGETISSNDNVLSGLLEAIDRHEKSLQIKPEVKNIDDYFYSLPRNTVEDESFYKLAIKKYEEYGCCPKCFNSMIACGDQFECTNCGIIWRI